MSFEPKGPVPIFPLPSVVLFPRAVLPLHVFELRYRTMVRETLSRERLIALALLKPGWESEYSGSPEYHPLACLGRIEEIEWLPNDCYDLTLLGLVRVRLGRPTREFPYRAAKATPIPQEPYSEDDPLVAMDKETLKALAHTLAGAAGATPPADAPEDDSYEGIVNRLCMTLPLEPAARLELLAMDSVIERGRRVCEMAVARPRRGRGPTGGDRN